MFKQQSLSVEELSADSCPAEFDVLKKNICPRSETFEGKYASFKNINCLHCIFYKPVKTIRAGENLSGEL